MDERGSHPQDANDHRGAMLRWSAAFGRLLSEILGMESAARDAAMLSVLLTGAMAVATVIDPGLWEYLAASWVLTAPAVTAWIVLRLVRRSLRRLHREAMTPPDLERINVK